MELQTITIGDMSRAPRSQFVDVYIVDDRGMHNGQGCRVNGKWVGQFVIKRGLSFFPPSLGTVPLSEWEIHAINQRLARGDRSAEQQQRLHKLLQFRIFDDIEKARECWNQVSKQYGSSSDAPAF